ncbi:MAG: hypothetical protein Q7J55_06845 [bacterium]|nr:hypothetical protein [bacterium]
MTNNNPYLKISKIYLALQRVQEIEVINLLKTSKLIPGLIVSVFLLFGQARAADVTPPLITNVYVSPNPFSPNGDERADVAEIYFAVSEPTYITMNVAGFMLLDSIFCPAGTNSYSWGGSGLVDGTYGINISGCDTAGNSSDTITVLATIDVIPPNIISLGATPNPFSPDNNGINDYCRIEFDVTHTHPPDFDEYFIPNKIGRISIWNDGTTHWTFTPDNTPVLPSFPVYFTLFPNSMSSDLSSITMHFLDWGSQIVDAQVSTKPGYYRVGDLTNKMDTVSFWVDSIPAGESAEIDLYASTGNAVIEIYDSTGTLVHHVDFWEIFKGNGDYFTLWGPGPIPDGLYNVKIIVEDEAYSIDVETMDVIANSIPTTVYDVYTELPIISPENQDNRYDITYIHYTLSEPVITSIKVFNSPTEFDSTHLVRTLVDGEQQSGGSHAILFDGKNDAGEFISSGCDSTYYVAIKVIDPITGDADFKITTIEIDNEAPDPPLLDLLPSPTNDSTAVLTGTAEPGDSVTIFLNSVLQEGVRTDSITGGVFSCVVYYEEGQNIIHAISYDEMLNASDTSNILFVLCDTRIPQVISTYPQSDEILSPPIARVWILLTDSIIPGRMPSGINFAVSSIVLKDGGGDLISGNKLIHEDTLIWQLSNTLDIPGSYYIYSSFRDFAGNQGSDSIPFYVFECPIIVYTYPEEGDTISEPLANVRAIIKDQTHTGLTNASVCLLKATMDTVPGELEVTNDTMVTWVLTDPLAEDGSDNGEYIVSVNAENGIGYTIDVENHFYYEYDTVPPPIPVLWPLLPAEICEDTISIKGKAEPGSLVELFLNYQLKDLTYSGTDSIFQFPEIKLIFGEMNYFGIVAVDSFDNTSDTLKFTIMASISAFAVSLPKPFNEDNYELLISIPEDGEVITQIYDLMSGLVWDESHTFKKGLHKPIYWYGLKNNDGRQVNNGIYVMIVTVKYNSGRIDKLKKLIAVVR